MGSLPACWRPALTSLPVTLAKLSQVRPIGRLYPCPIAAVQPHREEFAFANSRYTVVCSFLMLIKGRMKTIKKIVLLTLVVGLFAPTLLSMELPKAPSGFTWQDIPELKAAFLKPEGWFFKQEVDKGTLAYFITKEDITKTGQFDTGLTVNVFRLKQDSAVQRGKAMIDKMASDNHGKTWTQSVGAFQEFGCLIKQTDASGTIVMHALTVANPKTNTLYLFLFESPESGWDAAWKIGKPIMDTLAIDDDF
jgi:hypothetical protein